MNFKSLVLGLTLALGCAVAAAQAPTTVTQKPEPTAAERELIDLSKQKWQWMAARDIQSLSKLFDDQAMFVHMGATMNKADEIRVIESGRIEYKKADIEEISARINGDTGIVLSRIELFAMVGGNEARNPFTVTETFVKRSGSWKLLALAFTRRLTPPAAPPAPAPAPAPVKE
jgi:hypothetical protein